MRGSFFVEVGGHLYPSTPLQNREHAEELAALVAHFGGVEAFAVSREFGRDPQRLTRHAPGR